MTLAADSQAGRRRPLMLMQEGNALFSPLQGRAYYASRAHQPLMSGWEFWHNQLVRLDLRNANVIRHILPDQLETLSKLLVLPHVLNIALTACYKIVHANNIMALAQKIIAEVASKKACPACYEDPHLVFLPMPWYLKPYLWTSLGS